MRVQFELTPGDIYLTPLTMADAIVRCPQVNSDPDMIETIAKHLMNEAEHIRAMTFKESMRGV